ncbi:MAG: S-layer protein, partial [Clostridiales bacterium]
FSDLKPEHWAFESINYCADKKYLLGYPDNSFRPDAPMTRAEFCVMVKRLKKLNSKN